LFFSLFEEILASLKVLYRHLLFLYIFVHCNICIVFDIYCTGMLYNVIITQLRSRRQDGLIFYLYVSFLI